MVHTMNTYTTHTGTTFITHDDRYDYCEHGTYVGGCGIDYMCGWCEDGIFGQDYADHMTALARQRVLAKIADADSVIDVCRETGVNPTVVVELMWSVNWTSPWLMKTATDLGII